MSTPNLPNAAPAGDAYRQVSERVNGAISTIQPFHVRAVTASITADKTYGLYVCDATGGNITVSLPMAGAYKGVMFSIKKTDASGNTVTVDGNGAETIDGSATAVISLQNGSLTVRSDGTQWWIV